MKSRWNDAEAARAVEGRGAGVSEALALRTYSARLLGAEPALVLHGGGNTSVKASATTLFGDVVDVLHVKGSGWDLATIEPPGHPAVRMAPLLRLLELPAMSDEVMVNELRLALLDASAPTPSVETLLHAALPATFIDHTHADALLAVVDQDDARARAEEIFGDGLLFIPYVMPGFGLARACKEAWDTATRAGRAPTVMVLERHGIFTFGATAKESYERMIEAVTRCEQYAATHAKAARAPSASTPADASPAAAPEAETVSAVLAIVRGAFARAAGEAPERAPIVALRSSPRVLAFLARPDAAALTQRGCATPDHVLRTKPWPLHLTAPPFASSSAHPTAASSARAPSAKTTASSSASSSAHPTLAPSVHPTAASSAGASSVHPTASSSVHPTVASSASSSAHPTAASSAGAPSAHSTASSSVHPTVASSASSSAHPTAASSAGAPSVDTTAASSAGSSAHPIVAGAGGASSGHANAALAVRAAAVTPMFDAAVFAAQLDHEIVAYARRYDAYFDDAVAKKGVMKKRLDPRPRVVLVPGLGVCAIGKTKKEAEIAADVYEHTIDVIEAAEAVGTYAPVGLDDLFDVEYWSLEQAKLKRAAEPPLGQRVALVTGAASGIGRATATLFADLGAHVVLCDRDEAALADAAHAIGDASRIAVAVGDVTVAEDVARAFDVAARTFGGVDVVVSNAGVAAEGKLETADGEGALRASLEVNLLAHVNVARVATRVMTLQGRGGCLLFNASKSAFNQGPGFGPYAVSKAALVSLMRQYAVDLAKYGIRSNAVNADRIRTNIFGGGMVESRAAARGISVDDYFRSNLLGREVTARDVADSFAWLARATSTTGCVVTVDGGNAAAFPR